MEAIEIRGNTAFTIEQLRDAWAPIMGQYIPLSAIFDLAEALTARYRAAGYILSQVIVPAQEIRNDMIRLQVVEGHIAEVRVEGPPHAPLAAIHRYLDTILAERPMTTATLERIILLVNDLPGVTAETILSPSDNGTGAALMTLRVDKKRHDAFASVDNRGTVFLGPIQYSAGGDYFGAIQPEDRFSGRLIITAPTDELRYGEIGYETTLTPSGDKIRLRASHNSTHPTSTLTSLEVEGRGTTASAGLERPLLRSRSENLSTAASNGAISIGSIQGASRTLVLASGTGTLNINGTGQLGSLTLTQSGGTIFSGALDVTGATTIGSGAGAVNFVDGITTGSLTTATSDLLRIGSDGADTATIQSGGFAPVGATAMAGTLAVGGDATFGPLTLLDDTRIVTEPTNGAIRFNGSVNGGSASLTLRAGSGAISEGVANAITVAGLALRGGSARLSGSVGGQSGAAAARSIVLLSPLAAPNAGFLFNGCLAGHATCSVSVPDTPVAPALPQTPSQPEPPVPATPGNSAMSPVVDRAISRTRGAVNAILNLPAPRTGGGRAPAISPAPARTTAATFCSTSSASPSRWVAS